MSTRKFKQTAIINLSNAGSVGKSIFSSLILEVLRETFTVDAYSACDKNNNLYLRNGIRTERADKNNPTLGVKSFNIRDENARRLIADALSTDSEFVLFDMPADSYDDLIKVMGSVDELEELFEFSEFNLDIVSVIADEKSLASYKMVQQNFKTAKRIVIINEGLMKEKNNIEISEKAKAMATENNDKFFVITQKFSKVILDMIAENPLFKVYKPKSLREEGQTADDFMLNSNFDRIIMDKFLTTGREEVQRLYI